MSALAKLRNELAHNIANVGFSFNSYIEGLNKDNTNNFVKKFGHGLNDEIKIKDRLIPKRKFVLSNVKLSIWITAAEVLACLYLEIESTEIAIESEALAWYQKKLTQY